MMLYKLAFRFPRKVFFQNPDDLTLFLNKNLISAKSADLIPGSGIDLSHFTPTEFKRNDTFTFLLISRLITDKGIMEYVEAVRKLKSKGVAARFQILGAKDPEHARGIKLSVIDEWIKTGTIEYRVLLMMCAILLIRPIVLSYHLIGKAHPALYWKPLVLQNL